MKLMIKLTLFLLDNDIINVLNDIVYLLRIENAENLHYANIKNIAPMLHSSHHYVESNYMQANSLEWL